MNIDRFMMWADESKVWWKHRLLVKKSCLWMPPLDCEPFLLTECMLSQQSPGGLWTSSGTKRGCYRWTGTHKTIPSYCSRIRSRYCNKVPSLKAVNWDTQGKEKRRYHQWIGSHNTIPSYFSRIRSRYRKKEIPSVDRVTQYHTVILFKDKDTRRYHHWTMTHKTIPQVSKFTASQDGEVLRKFHWGKLVWD